MLLREVLGVGFLSWGASPPQEQARHPSLPIEVQKAKFEELKALDVDTEYKMDPVKFIDVIMTCVGKYLRTEAQTYMRQLNTQQPFTFEQLQAVVSTYEGSNFLMRTRSTAYAYHRRRR